MLNNYDHSTELGFARLLLHGGSKKSQYWTNNFEPYFILLLLPTSVVKITIAKTDEIQFNIHINQIMR